MCNYVCVCARYVCHFIYIYICESGGNPFHQRKTNKDHCLDRYPVSDLLEGDPVPYEESPVSPVRPALVHTAAAMVEAPLPCPPLSGNEQSRWLLERSVQVFNANHTP